MKIKLAIPKIKANKEELVILVLILILAAFFRLWRLDSIPPGLYPDEAVNANQGLSEPGKIFYPENNGREGLFNNLLAISLKTFGVSIFSARLVSAIAGILTVWGLYLLTKELFKTTPPKLQVPSSKFQVNVFIALFSAFFLAVCFWHVNFSRIIFRAILVPLISVFGFYFLIKALKKHDLTDFISAGLLFGLGFYTYLSYRLLVLILTPIVILYFLKNKDKKKQILGFLVAGLIVCLPLIVYFFLNPQDFIGRASGVSIFAQEKPIKAFTQSVFAHLAMFNFKGDPNWRHNLAGQPILFWPTGILFLIGLGYSIKQLIILIKNKKFLILDTPYLILIIWWLVMLLPGMLTYEGIPHSLRVIGAIPPVFIFVGLGAYLLYEAFKKFINKHLLLRKDGFETYLLSYCLCLLIFSFVFASYNHYFQVWANEPEVKNGFSQDYVNLGFYLNSLDEKTKKYVIVNHGGVLVNGLPVTAQTPMFIETAQFKEPQATYLLPDQLSLIIPQNKTVIALMGYDRQILIELLMSFPDGKIDQENNLWLFEINN